MELNRASTAMIYERWEEFYVSTDEGKREVHYYLKKKDGSGSDLVIIGKEKKNLSHMSYHLMLFNVAAKNSSSFFMAGKQQFRSRREVVDWLNSIAYSSDSQPQQSIKQDDIYVESKADNPCPETITQKMGQDAKTITWLGSPWTCRKRRRHYKSFSRNGVEISVQNFLYVLAEEGERLVAYLDDMYEDSKGNKMVVVQWFHRFDEVGTVLPRNYSDREIFFSLCLQDISIECIDGLATVLSPEHYEKYLNEAKCTQLEPFICHRQFDNDEVKPLDITRVKGYWEQNALRYLFFSSSSKPQLHDDAMREEGNPSDAVAVRPKKRLRRSQDCDNYLQTGCGKGNANASLEDCIGGTVSCRGVTGGVKEGFPATYLGKNKVEQMRTQCISIGCQVEVLSQDSGMRGCWFRALIVKKHKDKVKVQYQDIKDVTDEAKYLEEWVLASRLAAPYALSGRRTGRTIVRPAPLSNKGKVSWVFNVGALVDVWWNDGWWEGIIVKKESNDRLHVYFPGEKQKLIFGCCDTRHSQEWLETGWKQLKERPDIASALSVAEVELDISNRAEVKPEKAAPCHRKELSEKPTPETRDRNLEDSKSVRDLSKDDLLLKLRWKSSRRRRGRIHVDKVHYAVNDRGHNRVDQLQTYRGIFTSSTLKKDPDNCKFIGDSIFSPSVVSPYSNLVMSR